MSRDAKRYKWKSKLTEETCDSCKAAHGQVHSDWGRIKPKSDALYCGENCRCTLEPTDDDEQGSLSSIPVRGENMTLPTIQSPIRERFTAHGRPNEHGEFEIIGINVGEANGWTFGEAVLQASLPLWNGAHCYVDHGWFGHSVRDLGGISYAPQWDPDRKGVQLKLRTLGPSGPLVEELGRQMLDEDLDPKPDVGFSADVIFTATGRAVETILRVLSLDLVVDPARGGAFLRALNSLGAVGAGLAPALPAPIQATVGRQEVIMPTPVTPAQGDAATTPAATPVGADLASAHTIVLETQRANAQGAQDVRVAQEQAALQLLLQEQQRIDAEVQGAQLIRQEMCQHLLNQALGVSHLPNASQTRIRKQFADRVFEPTELNAAIEDARLLVSELTAGALVQGPGRISAMYDTCDKLQAAVDDMLGAPRDKAHVKLSTHRLSGIRELYHMLTGDYDYHGGYYPDRVQLGGTTTDFSGLVKNAMNKVVIARWAEMGRAGYSWWEKIATVEHMNTLNQITWILTGTVGRLPVVAEQGEYNELNAGDSPETSNFVKYGGYIPLTLESIDRDETRKLAQYPKELATSALRTISKEVSDIFTDNAGIGPTLADTGALFNATALATAGGHLNLLTTALAAAEWDVVSTAVYVQPMLVKNAAGVYGTGDAQAINPRYCLVPRELQLTAMKILYPTLENAANIYSENQQRGQPGDVLTVPEWTDATDWAAVVDPVLVPGIMIGERFGIMPEIYVSGSENIGAVFTHDEHRIKVRHFLAVGVADFRPLHKSNVAG